MGKYYHIEQGRRRIDGGDFGKKTMDWMARRTGEEFGADGVEISAHNYCAMDHLPFQGKQFSHKQFEDVQNSLKRQFGMWNCRYTVHAIILGLSEPLYTEDERQAMIAQSTEKIEFEGKQYTRYEATQLQRRIETSVRHSKDRAMIFKASGDDLSRRVEQLRINQLKQKYSEITNIFKTPPALDRMSVSGFRAVKAGKPYKGEVYTDLQLAQKGKLFDFKSNDTETILHKAIDYSGIYGNNVLKSDRVVFAQKEKAYIHRGHPEDVEWFIKNQDLVLKAITNPSFIENIPSIHAKTTYNVAHILSIQEDGSQFLNVVLNFRTGKPAKIWTMFRAGEKYIYDINGSIKTRWRKP